MSWAHDRNGETYALISRELWLDLYVAIQDDDEDRS